MTTITPTTNINQMKKAIAAYDPIAADRYWKLINSPAYLQRSSAKTRKRTRKD